MALFNYVVVEGVEAAKKHNSIIDNGFFSTYPSLKARAASLRLHPRWQTNTPFTIIFAFMPILLTTLLQTPTPAVVP
jgi:hypothetical protein